MTASPCAEKLCTPDDDTGTGRQEANGAQAVSVCPVTAVRICEQRRRHVVRKVSVASCPRACAVVLCKQPRVFPQVPRRLAADGLADTPPAYVIQAVRVDSGRSERRSGAGRSDVTVRVRGVRQTGARRDPVVRVVLEQRCITWILAIADAVVGEALDQRQAAARRVSEPGQPVQTVVRRIVRTGRVGERIDTPRCRKESPTTSSSKRASRSAIPRARASWT